MRPSLLLAGLAVAGCAGDGSDDPGDPRVPACASELFRAIYDGSVAMVPRGTVSIEDYVTGANIADPDVLIDGPAIFPAFRELIASAEHDVSLQTYVWEPGSDPANEILAGLVDLAERRAREAPDAPPVTVRFLFDASTLNFGSLIETLPITWGNVQALGLDPRHVTFELAGFYHLAMGNLHVKTLVVDGTEAILTGANPQAHHDYEQPWRDAGYRLSGAIAAALEADFRGAWLKGAAWTCGGDTTIDYESCMGAVVPMPEATERRDVTGGACLPMLLVTRQADANPASNRTDNTQDQAFLAAFKAASTHIRMQTPNLNDDAAKGALLAAVERGVRVDIVLSKGFNDSTEDLPGQGGTNEENVAELYAAVAAMGIADPCSALRVRWYSRDGVEPVVGNGVYASHAKYSSLDDTVVIVGTANMDTQSWNNSREVNVVVDDPEITRAWDDQFFLVHFDTGIVVDQCR